MSSLDNPLKRETVETGNEDHAGLNGLERNDVDTSNDGTSTVSNGGNLNDEDQKITDPNSMIRMRLLPTDFQPSATDVLCGRGRKAKLWKGNVEYRKLVARKLEAYSDAKTKLDKGIILRDIVDQVRKNSPNGGFVKQDRVSERWYEIGDFLAREKTSQYFRDALHEKYSSSAQSKYQRRKTNEAKLLGKTPPLISELKRSSVSAEIRSISGIEKSLIPKDATPNTKISHKPEEPPISRLTQHVDSQPSTKTYNVDRRTLQRRPSEDAVANVLQQMACTNRSVEEVIVCAVQVELRKDDETPEDATARVIKKMELIASQQKVDIFVLPELCPMGYSKDTFERFMPVSPEIRDLYVKIEEALANTARNLDAFICYGTIGWKTMVDETVGCTIRQVVVNRTGREIAAYDKVFLCDYGDSAETRFFIPGNKKPVSFSIDGFKFGLLICTDIRNPELSRQLAKEHKIDVLLQPSAFSRGTSFRTWKSFRETRAVENSVYFIGINYAGENFGETSVTPPWIDDKYEPILLGTNESFLFGRIERATLDWVRSNVPFYRQMQGSTS